MKELNHPQPPKRIMPQDYLCLLRQLIQIRALRLLQLTNSLLQQLLLIVGLYLISISVSFLLINLFFKLLIFHFQNVILCHLSLKLDQYFFFDLLEVVSTILEPIIILVILAVEFKLIQVKFWLERFLYVKVYILIHFICDLNIIIFSI